MRKSTTPQDRPKYPNYFYDPFLKSVSRIDGADKVDWRWDCHHYISQQWIDLNPEKFEEIEHLQKLFFLPRQLYKTHREENGRTWEEQLNVHGDLHNVHSDFEEKWGFSREEFIYTE